MLQRAEDYSVSFVKLGCYQSESCQDVRFLHCNGDIGKMTLIRLCSAQKEVVGDGGRKGMKERRGSPAGKCSVPTEAAVTLSSLHQDVSVWHKMVIMHRFTLH